MTTNERNRTFHQRQRQNRKNLRLVAPEATRILGLAARIEDPAQRLEIVEAATEIWNLAQAALPGSPLDSEA